MTDLPAMSYNLAISGEPIGGAGHVEIYDVRGSQSRRQCRGDLPENP